MYYIKISSLQIKVAILIQFEKKILISLDEYRLKINPTQSEWERIKF